MKEHYEALRKKQARTRVVLEKEFVEKFPEERGFLEKLYVQQRLNPVSHLGPILELATIYPREAMSRAFALAHEYNTFSHHFIRGLLEREMPLEVSPETKTTTLWSVPAIKVDADLSAYQELMGVKS